MQGTAWNAAVGHDDSACRNSVDQPGVQGIPSGLSTPCRGRAPSRPVGKGVVSRQFLLVPECLQSSRRGGPMCPPAPLFARPVHGPTHRSAPTKRPLTPKNRAGTEPRPYSRRMPVRDLPGHPQPRLPQGEMPGMTTGTPLSSFVPCSNVLRNRNPRKLRDGFQRRAQPSLWS